MGVHPDLLEVLACPVCKIPVVPTDDETGLRCAGCRRVYPIVDEIPVMLVEEAKTEV